MRRETVGPNWGLLCFLPVSVSMRTRLARDVKRRKPKEGTEMSALVFLVPVSPRVLDRADLGDGWKISGPDRMAPGNESQTLRGQP
jgi:hypothetical protein